MSEFGNKKADYLTRLATNTDQRFTNAVLCVRHHPAGKPQNLQFVRSLAVPTKIRSSVGRRISGRAGKIASTLLERSIAQQIRRSYAPDIIHVQDGGFAGEKAQLIQYFNTPVVTTFHGGDINLAPFSSTRIRRLKQVFAFSSMCHFVSDFLLNKGRQLGCPENKGTAIHLGTQIREWKPRTHDAATVTYGCIANMVSSKGHHDLLVAFAKFHEKHPNSKLILAGDAPLRHRIDWLIESLHIQHAVQCTGSVGSTEILQLLNSKIDVLVHPACKADDGSEEALGLVLCESSERGIPAIASAIGGIPEVIKHQVNGLLIDERNPTQLAEALTRMHSSHELRTQMGTAARDIAIRSFNSAKQLECFAELYLNIHQNQLKQTA